MPHDVKAYSPCGEHDHPHVQRPTSRWLLIKGLARQAGHWHEFPQQFADTLGVQVECLDLPGTGTERHRPSPKSIGAIVDDLRSRWLRRQVCLQREYVLGLSLGGMVALDWMHRFPDDFAGGVLLNTSAQRVGWPLERLRPAAVATFGKLLVTRQLQQRERLILQLCTADTPALCDRYLSERVVLGRNAPVSIRTFAAQLRAAARYRAPPSTRVPLLVLAGAKDRLTSPRCSQRLARRLNARLQVHFDAGHELTLDDPHWVAQQVATWLKEPGPSETG